MAQTYYKPSCAADCTTDTNPVFGDLCAGVSTIEMGEITDIIFDDIDTGSTPANPITGWVSTGLAANDAVNSAAITTWFSGVDNTTAGGLKHIEVTGDKSEPTGTEIELPKGKKITINAAQTVKVSTPVINNQRYEAYRKLQCLGDKIFWFATDTHLYGGINGMKAQIKKAYFTFPGRNTPKQFNLELEFLDSIDPPRDKKTWS
jgi:hypothetical protein